MEVDGARKARQRATERTQRTLEAWRSRGEGPRVVQTPRGEVILERVERGGDGSAAWLEVWVGGEPEGGDPHFRVINPPLLVQDPDGDVEVHGRRFREDPLAALAEAVSSNGGAIALRGRTHGR